MSAVWVHFPGAREMLQILCGVLGKTELLPGEGVFLDSGEVVVPIDPRHVEALQALARQSGWECSIQDEPASGHRTIRLAEAAQVTRD